MKKSAIIGLALLVILIIISGVFFFTRGDSLKKGINEYESGDYVEAIEIFNRLIPYSNYDDSEKIYFYRCKALNGLIDELEEDYDDELRDMALENKDKPAYEKAVNKIQSKLNKINSRIGSDLVIVPGQKKSSIASRGLFYNEFFAKYKGSQFLEELDFFELKKNKIHDGTRIFEHISSFYDRYPNSIYTPQIVSMIFDAIREATVVPLTLQDRVKNIIINFAVRYPSSQEVSRIYISSGDSVNLRNSPGTNSAITGKTVKDELLIQLEKSMDTMQVGDTRDYWYRVATLRGVSGWIFGKFLSPIDIQKFTIAQGEEIWSLNDNFSSWSDSNTPENWSHIMGGDASAVNFRRNESGNTIVYNSKGIAVTGLFRRCAVSKNFSVALKARFISGNPIVILSYVFDSNNSFSISLDQDKVDINGRSIPLNGTQWHIFEISSSDGRFASFSVDGELLAGRVPPASNSPLKEKGLYLLYQSAGASTACEVEFVRLR
ncbi:MAG TPA: SH3 domain-containing protein [Spirochaetota bacterium]|nr:SH3 domain-containing protein [Spirochaetota bacterium]